MKKIYVSLLVLVLTAAVAKAQSNKAFLSFGPELSIPFNTSSTDYGRVRDYYQDGLGGSLKIELPLSPSLHFTGSAGFVYYHTNTHYYYSSDISAGEIAMGGIEPPPYKFVPVKAGFQFYYDKFFYISADAGAAIKANSASTNSFIYSGGLGAVIPFKANNGLDLGVRFERGYKIVDYPYAMSQIAIRVAYRFGL